MEQKRKRPVFRVTGSTGTLKVGWQLAATFADWELERDTGAVGVRCAFRGRVVGASPFWLTQGPFDLTLTVGRALWTWSGIPAVRQCDGEPFIEAELASQPQVEAL